MEWFYTICLFVAVFANLKEARMVFMCFLVGWFLILIPHALPDSDTMGINWFWMLIVIEILFGAVIYSIGSKASQAILFLCWMNVLTHSISAWYFYQYGITPPFHQIVLRASELCQILSLLLYSEPSIALFVNALAKHKRRDKGDGRFKLVATAG